ncbi:hypothetical protein [Paenibacillus sp. FSL R7-277]|uniref:hypothetical protein n=1 Tax=Paenibacillus sp. FSL R7-277 TaxID=1227352 RepID=UPI0009DE61CA|nr:hypothetical protein [Paenibacillus sp. FSL R7-277]
MSNLILKHWTEECELPGINCIAWADGSITILNIEIFYDPNTRQRTMTCSPLCDTTIESIVKYNDDPWTIVDAWMSLDYEGGTIYGGDGQMGNEGFIACTGADGNMVWAIFSDVTNPIKQLSIEDRTLIAMNEHDELRIEINLDHLTEMRLIPCRK